MPGFQFIQLSVLLPCSGFCLKLLDNLYKFKFEKRKLENQKKTGLWLAI